jgi:hypothetical protein
MVLLKRSNRVISFTNWSSETSSPGFGFVVKWTHHRMRRTRFLIIRKEKHSILNNGSVFQKPWKWGIWTVLVWNKTPTHSFSSAMVTFLQLFTFDCSNPRRKYFYRLRIRLWSVCRTRQLQNYNIPKLRWPNSFQTATNAGQLLFCYATIKLESLQITAAILLFLEEFL